MSLRLFDNTRISSHSGCNRRYYFRHVRNFAGKGVSPALAFGSSWHAAMDVLWSAMLTDGKSPMDTYQLSCEAFYNTWIKEGAPLSEQMTDEQKKAFGNRTEVTAERMLSEYIGRRWEFMLRNFKLLYTERPFVVPISNDNSVLYCGKIDKIILWNGSTWAIEHKTTGSGTGKGGFYRTWLEQWSNNRQVDGYIHALHMIYGNTTRGVLIDGALTCGPKTEPHFEFIPIEKDATTLDAWLFDVHAEIKRIFENEQNEKISVTPTLHAWPRNTNTCIDFNSVCPWIGFCRTIPNPAVLTDEEYLRYNEHLEISKWSPFDAARLEELGLTRELSGEL